ncbi:hypothetical protein ACUIG4_26545 [Raoultella ornithinolytica]|uniref:hypothetical protein n=1 Tax=Raoultella ornithinolytica TaxID=54291 RepID=UPI00403DD3DD
MTSKLTITDERLAELVAFKPLPGIDINSATRDEWMAMAAELQERRKAAIDSEPVAYMYDGEDGREYNGHNEFSGGGKGIPLYRHAQPAQVVPETAHSSVIAEQLAHVLSDMKVTDHQRAVISCAVDRLNNVAQLLQLSPSALLVPEILDYQGAKELYNYLMTEEETNATVNAWNACRAAMLNGGKS